MSDSPFRGIQGIREAKTRMLPLISWYRKYKPEVQEICISRTDYDLIARWPKAANSEDFVFSDSGIWYEGLRLTYDTGEGRYVKSPRPEQEVIR